jgi:hypothetical protein
MIKYALRCTNEHEFEAWFNSSAAFDDQKSAALLRCPVCETDKVEKALMAPRVVTRKGHTLQHLPSETAATPSAPEPAPNPKTGGPDKYAPVSSDPRHTKIVDLMRQLRQRVEATTEDVGKRFAEEARKIHYDETEPRGIRGEATAQEVRDLQDEGVTVTPLPRLPDDHN